MPALSVALVALHLAAFALVFAAPFGARTAARFALPLLLPTGLELAMLAGLVFTEPDWLRWAAWIFAAAWLAALATGASAGASAVWIARAARYLTALSAGWFGVSTLGDEFVGEAWPGPKALLLGLALALGSDEVGTKNPVREWLVWGALCLAALAGIARA
jgi:hypothetical protein